MKTVRILLTTVSILFLLTLACFAAFYFGATRNVFLDENKLAFSKNTVEILDDNGARIEQAALLLKDRNFTIDELDEKRRYAFIDVEDKRFYSHRGFDWRRIAKAALNNLKAGAFKEGASTISQQLVKNTHLTQEKTLKRKLKEYKLTRRLEQKYTKDEILEKYLNGIYFGHNCFGISSAAQFYFSKTPKELTLADTAVLSGLIRSPNNYSPFKHPENCLRRKKVVLNAMLRQNHITKDEYKQALSAPLPTPSEHSDAEKSYLFKVFEELGELAEEHALPIGGTLKISTYLDSALQTRLGELSAHSDTDKIYTVLDVERGGFQGYYSTVATPSRLPASLLKPLLVYAPALELGEISPATPLLDEPVSFSGYSPKNYDGKFSGYVSAREALSKSLNVPAVKLLNSLGVKRAAQYLTKTGLPVADDDLSLALALGGMQKGYPLTDLAAAYATLARGGEYHKGAFIKEICIDGVSLYRHRPQKSRVYRDDTAYLVTDMLQTAAKTGTAKKLSTLPFSIAAKTGTGGDETGNVDAYTVSYTPQHVVGVWMGNADGSKMHVTGGGAPCNAAADINRFLYLNAPPKPFTLPPSVKRLRLDKTEYYDKHNILLADDLAPPIYTLSELFSTRALPVQKSDKFTNPHIISPILRYEEGKVHITFPDAPAFYEYIIDRYDYVTHTTVFSGKYQGDFTDGNLEKNKDYLYSVTPVFQGRKGTPIPLPTVTTKSDGDDLIPVLPTPPPDIVDKDWWNK